MFWNRKKKPEQELINDTPIPDISIPDLKKEKEDKKKAAIPIGGGGKGAQAFTGARGAGGAAGGARAAASAASASRAAIQQAIRQASAGMARSALGQAGFLGRFLASAAGKMVAAGVVAAVLGGAGVAAYQAMKGGGTAGGPGTALGALSSGIKVDRSGGDHTKVVGDSSMFASPQSAKAAQADTNAEAGPSEQAGVGEQGGPAAEGGPAEAAGPGQQGGKSSLGSLAGAQLSSSLGGGGSAASFSIPGDQGDKRASLSGFGGPKSDNKGTAGMARRNAARKTSFMSRYGGSGKASSSRSFGRLKAMAGANRSMMSGGQNATEAHSESAATQFDGTSIDGSVAPGGVNGAADTYTANLPDTSDPGIPDCGADAYPDMTSGACVGIPKPPPVENPNMWNKITDEINDMMNKIRILLIAAIATMATGFIWMCTGCCAWVGAILYGIGVVIAAVALLLSEKLRQLGKKLKRLGVDDMGDKVKSVGENYEVMSTLVIALGVWTPIIAFSPWYLAAAAAMGVTISTYELVSKQTVDAPKPPNESCEYDDTKCLEDQQADMENQQKAYEATMEAQNIF